MRLQSPPVLLTHGSFFGHYAERLAVPGFSIATMVPTLHEDEVVPHRHAEAHLVLLLAGEYLSTAHGAPAVVRAPALIYNPAGTEHRDRFRGDGRGGRFVTLSVAPATLRAVECAVALPDHPLLLGAAALQIAQGIAREVGRANLRPPLAIESLCIELLDRTAADAECRFGAPPAWLRRARALLHDDCGADLTLTAVAAVAGVHVAHLTRSFRRYFGRTPGDYLRRCRLDKAAAHLTSRQLPLPEIAADCGYFDQSHFTHDFKRAFGATPLRYRHEMCGRGSSWDTRPA